MTGRRVVIGVMGASTCDAATGELARGVGRGVAARGAVLLCGGRGGVMEAAAQGAREAGGLVVGLLPGRSEAESPPNRFVEVAVFTGLGEGRNYVNACASDALIAIGGGWGTLSEIALARKLGRPVVLLGPLELGPLASELDRAATAEEAVERAFAHLR